MGNMTDVEYRVLRLIEAQNSGYATRRQLHAALGEDGVEDVIALLYDAKAVEQNCYAKEGDGRRALPPEEWRYSLTLHGKQALAKYMGREQNPRNESSRYANGSEEINNGKNRFQHNLMITAFGSIIGSAAAWLIEHANSLYQAIIKLFVR